MSGVRVVPSCGRYAMGFGTDCDAVNRVLRGSGMTSTLGMFKRSSSSAAGHITASRRIRSYPASEETARFVRDQGYGTPCLSLTGHAEYYEYHIMMQNHRNLHSQILLELAMLCTSSTQHRITGGKPASNIWSRAALSACK